MLNHLTTSTVCRASTRLFPRKPRSPRRGFSFAEVMFAVVILGVGFILIAAIFPVATEQARTTNDEAIAAVMARQAMATIRSSTTSADYTNTNGSMQCFSLYPNLQSKVSASMINQANPRYAWIPFFSWNGGTSGIQITVLVVRRWNRDVYTAEDLSADLSPRSVSINSITPMGDGSHVAAIARDSLGMYQCVTDGCYLIMHTGDGDVVGHGFQVGRYLSEDVDSVLYQLTPGNGFGGSDSCGVCSAALIGRDCADNYDPNNPQFIGPSQDVAVYSTLMLPN